MLALTGQVDTQVLGPGAFQEVDLSGAFGSVAAFSQPVLHDSKHVELMNLACKNALLRRDVSHLIFPDEVQTLPAPAGRAAGGPDGRITPLDISPPEESIASALKLLRGAKRPVMVVGHGARFHMPAVIAFAEQLGAPVITTFKAKGQIGDDHPLAAGVLGRSGTPVASWVMNEADLLLVLGASFSNHTGHLPRPPDHPGRLRPHAARASSTRSRCPSGARSASSSIGCAARSPRASRPTTRPRSSPSAGRSGGPRRPAVRRTTAAPA